MCKLAFYVCFALLACAHAADFNGDGKADLLFRSPDGTPVLWYMNGTTRTLRSDLESVADPNWAIATVADFDGDGLADIFWIHSDGYLVIWPGNFPQGQACIVNASISGSWQFAGAGDFNGDGKSDLLWRRPDTNAVMIWFMNGCQVAAQQTLAQQTAPAGASATIADLNGDGDADIVWTTASGNVTFWLMNGATVTNTATATAPGGATLAASGDFNGDGKDDLAWSSNGRIIFWFMNGTSYTSTPLDGIFAAGFETGDIGSGAALPADGWTILSAADLNGDGKCDLILGYADGRTRLLELNGASIIANKILPADYDMPYPGLTGWVLSPPRPVVTKSNGQVTVAATAYSGSPAYTLYYSATPQAAQTGTAMAMSGAPPHLTYTSGMPPYTNARYFSVGVSFFGMVSPPSPDAYLLEFSQTDLGYLGPMVVADINYDDCIDILGALGDCHGGFTLFPEASMGLGALRTPGRIWRDLRFADFDGDGIDDVIANTYSDLTDTGSRILFFRGIGNGQFVEDTDFTALGYGGYGETIVVADFNNDGCLDIFLPNYTFYNTLAQNYLLINDCHGHFTEMADQAGVAMRNWDSALKGEGAQAVDFDGDGRIDLYVGSHLFMNKTTDPSQPWFVDERVARGLPLLFDEGAKFVDWNNDGNLDLVLLDPGNGPQLWQSDGTNFHFVNIMPPGLIYYYGAGLNAVDLDNDGRPDLVISGGCVGTGNIYCNLSGGAHALPLLYLNRGDAYVQADFFDDGIADPTQRWYNTMQSFADFDQSGTADVASLFVDFTGTQAGTVGNIKILTNRASDARAIAVTMYGPNGERNQYGRVVYVSPLAQVNFVMTGIVDGGSGYLSISPYTMHFAAPFPGNYEVQAHFADRTISVIVHPGDHINLYDTPSGQRN